MINVVELHEDTNERFIAAIRNNNPDLAIQIVDEEFADVNYYDDDNGESVSHAAIESDHGLQLIHRIWEDDNFDQDSVNNINVDGLTPLTLAARAGDLDVVRYILEECPHRQLINVNAIEDVFETHFTALHAAAENGNRAIANLLIKHGADLTILNSEGLTAAQVAQNNNHHQLAATLNPTPPAQAIAATTSNQISGNKRGRDL